MKHCNDCKHAMWARTAAGKLHPSGEGRCGYEVKAPLLPASMHWLSPPRPFGGLINRREELRDHCVFFARASE